MRSKDDIIWMCCKKDKGEPFREIIELEIKGH